MPRCGQSGAIISLIAKMGRTMSDTLEYMKRRAHELARSGKFSGWRSVAFELQFEPALKEVFQWLHSASVEDAFQWLHSPATKEGIDQLCYEARSASTRHDPEAADVFCGGAVHGPGDSPAATCSSRTESR